MKQRILFVVFSILLIAGVACQNVGNKTFVCEQSKWENWNGGIEKGILTAGENVEGRMLNSGKCLVGKGNYTVTVLYSSSVPGSRVTAEAMGMSVLDIELPVSEEITSISVPMTLEQEGGGVSFHVDKAPGGVVSIREFDIAGEKLVNCDYIYLAVLMTALSAVLYYLLFLNRGRIDRKHLLTALVLATAACFVSMPMFRSELFKGSDLTSYLFGIEGMKDALKSGQFPAYVFPYGMNGYGRAGGLLPSLFLYPAVFLRMAGVSLLTSYKSLLFAVNLGTGIIAYFSAKRLFGQKEKPALLFAVLYLTAFYRVSVLWNRSDLGELLAMMFLPLIAVGLYELLAGDRKKWWYLAVGYGCLLQCHIPSFVIAVLFSLFMGIWYVDRFFREKRWMELLKVSGSVLAFSAWYLVPLASYWKAGVSMTGQDVDFCGGLLYVMDLLLMDANKTAQEVQAGYLGLSALFCGFFALTGLTMEKQKDERQKYLSVLLAGGVCFSFMATALVPWQLLEQVKGIGRLTGLIGYSRRFLGPATAALLLAGTGWLAQSRFLKKYAVYISGVTVLASMLATLNVVDWQVDFGTLVTADTLPAAVEQTGLLAGTDPGDLAPFPRTSDEGKVTVADYGRDKKGARLRVSGQTENQFVEFPIFNYPGYRAYDQNGTRLPVETGSNNRARVLLQPSAEEQTITLRFAGKKIFLGGYAATLASVVWAIGYINRKRLRQWTGRRTGKKTR